MLKKAFTPTTISMTLSSLLVASPITAQAEFLPSDGFYADLRYRYENVDQDGIAKEADASTLRTRFGYQSGIAHGLQFLIEGEDVSRIGSTQFNNTLNGKTQYPVVADPVGTELNQAWLAYSGIADTTLKAGRQGINLDNQRFIGTVGWRQNDQTYDAWQISNTSLDNLTLTFIDIDQVNRIFGEDAPMGKLDTTTRAAHVTYQLSSALSITGYGYWLDIDEIASLSSKTYGLRATGQIPLRDNWKLVYEIEAAEQEDYEDNTASYSATYYHLAPAITGTNWTLGIGFESLEGDGANAFQTPLATLHKFNGWADKFLTTPPNGLEDLYGKAVYTIKGQSNWLDDTKIVLIYHDFNAENGSSNYGEELDIEVSHPLNVSHIPWLKGGAIALKYAYYDADDFATDTEKLWLSLQASF